MMDLKGNPSTSDCLLLCLLARNVPYENFPFAMHGRSTVQYITAVLHLYCIILYSTVLYYTILCCITRRKRKGKKKRLCCYLSSFFLFSVSLSLFLLLFRHSLNSFTHSLCILFYSYKNKKFQYIGYMIILQN